MTTTPARAALAYLDHLCARLDRGLKLRSPLGRWWKAGPCVPLGLTLCLAACTPELPPRPPSHSPFEVCDDGIDNDHNGLVDCSDFRSCRCDTPNENDPYAGRERDCRDGLDDDGDGRVDCYDEDCWDVCSGAEYAAPAPVAAKERRCDDGIDNDGDGLVDCQDLDCSHLCVVPPYAAPRPIARREYDCFDGMDDDGDGAVDCEDVDCIAVCQGAEYAAPVHSFETNCRDGIDNDADGLTDWADPDCQPSVALYAAPMD